MFETFSSGYNTYPLLIESKQDWEGLSPEKFRLIEKKHYESRDSMKYLEAKDLPFLGRKHYTPRYGKPKFNKPSLRMFPHMFNAESVEGEAEIKTKEEFKPTPKPYGHKERLHMYPEGSKEAQFLPSIKTFHPLDANKNEINFDKVMGRKRIIDCLEMQRNFIGVSSLGDKIYKHPEYAPRFYHERGLIVGSTNSIKVTKKPIDVVPEQKTKSKGTTWKDRVKMDERDEEEKAVLSLFDWEKTTLKEGNPKWRDPDEVEPELPKKFDGKTIDQKNVKKK